MQKRLHACLAGLRQHQGIGRLLLLQLAVALACVWLGLTLYQFQLAASDYPAMLLALALLAGFVAAPQMARGMGGFVIAAGVMLLLRLLLPVAWFQGPGMVFMAAISAALAVWLSRLPSE